jgi:hypothetical protein
MPSLRLLLIVGFAALIGCVAGARRSEQVLAADLHLEQRGREIRTTLPFRAPYARSELLVELPGIHLQTADGRITNDRGEKVSIGASLSTIAGERMNLEDIRAIDHGGRSFLRLSSKALDDPKQPRSFSSVTLWSDDPIATGKVVWISYDPSTTNGAEPWPEALR